MTTRETKEDLTSQRKHIREIIFRNKVETTLTIPIKINNLSVMAVVDTGAEISVISHELAKSLNKSLRREQEVKFERC